MEAVSSVNGEGDETPPSPQGRFEAKSYLERQVERLGCEDEAAVQEKVSKRLELKQERAQKKRDLQLQRRRKSISERHRKIRDARKAMDHKVARSTAALMERHLEKHTSATRRRRTSLENIKKARALHNRRVMEKRQETESAPGAGRARTKSMEDIEIKLARAEKNRETLRSERRRRNMARYEEGKARMLGGQGGLAGEVGREQRRRRLAETRQAARARLAQRMRLLRRRMQEAHQSSAASERRRARAFAARLLQRWWRCVSAGRPFDVAALEIPTSPDTSPGTTPEVSPGGRLDSLDPMSISPVRVGERSIQAFPLGPTEEGADDRLPFPSSHSAALAIQGFLRRNLHPLKVAKALVAARPSLRKLCDAVRQMSSATFDEAIEIMSSRSLLTHCEVSLKALRMGREMRSVPHATRSARAFLSALLVNFYPTTALDDEGAMSLSPEGSAPLQREKDRLIRASGSAIEALLGLEAAVETATAKPGAEPGAGPWGEAEASSGESEGDDSSSSGAGGSAGASGVSRAPAGVLGGMDAAHFLRLRRAGASLVRARVAFCRRFAEWKRKDALRLADEMTAASVDILLMQLRAERDLRVAAVRYGLEETDDSGALFSTGYAQIKEGTQRQLGKMMAALGKLVGRDQAHRRMEDATDAAFERLRADEIEEEEAFLNRVGALADERMGEEMSIDSRAHDARVAAAAAGGTSAGDADVGPLEPGTEGRVAEHELEEEEEEEEVEAEGIAGPSRPLSAGDLLGNEWLVHEVMMSQEPLQISLEEAVENQLLRSGSPATGRPGFWDAVTGQVAAGDYTPLLQLVAELRDKIIGLTPRRKDLAAETCEAMDVELLAQMMRHGAFDVGSFFKMISFAGERILELEAPVRNDVTRETLAKWGRTQREVEGGASALEPEMVKECFQFLFGKTDEIHVDILNAHLQFVTPFLKQHGVEYERDRFMEKLEAGETSLDTTHLWLHRAVRQLRARAPAPAPSSPSSSSSSSSSSSAASGEAAAAAAVAAAAAAAPKHDPGSPEFAAALLSDLEQRRGNAYLTLLRVAMVDNLLGAIVTVDRKPGGGLGREAGPGAQAVLEAEEESDGVAVPETLCLDQFRLVVVAAGVEQVAYTATLIAFVQQTLGAARLPLKREEEEKIRSVLMVLFETDDASSADICAQVEEMARAAAARARTAAAATAAAGRGPPPPPPLSAAALSALASRAKNVLSTGDCPVYKLFLGRTLGVARAALVAGGMGEEEFGAKLASARLGDFRAFMLNRVVRPLVAVERHHEAVFSTYYNEIIPLAMQTANPAAAAKAAHEAAMNVD